MIEIRILEDNEKQNIRPLYEEVFQDSEYFTSYYFNEYIKGAINFVYQIDDEIVSMAAIHEKQLIISEKSAKAGYVFAVATKKEYRGRGFMGALLKEIEAYALKNNYDYLYLIPVAEGIYERYGYRLIRKGWEKIYTIGDKTDNKVTLIRTEKNNIPQIVEYMKKWQKDRVLILQNEDYFCKKMDRLSINNSGIYCIFNDVCDKILGLASVEDDEETVISDLYVSGDYEEIFMNMLMNRLKINRLTYRVHSIMFKEINAAVEELFDYSMCINDEI